MSKRQIVDVMILAGAFHLVVGFMIWLVATKIAGLE